MNQDRMDSTSEKSVPNSTYYASGSATDVPSTASDMAMQPVCVQYGANEEYFNNGHGKTVAYWRRALRDSHNIPNDAEALIDGKKSSDDQVVLGGSKLAFFKEAGVKGASLDPTCQR